MSLRGIHIFLFLVLSMCLSSTVSADKHTLDNGDQIAWDGTYYDFRDVKGVQMIKLWIPPDTDPVRGVFISGHGGGGGDSRNFARDENVRALAMRLGFAVAGLHNFPGRRVYSQGAAVFFQALDAFAGLGHHPELANLPFVMYGSSNGGASTYGFVNYAPERAICFVANVSAGYRPEVPVDAALQVPGIHIIGKFDALIGQRGIDRTQALIESVRPKGALWTWALELKGHEDGFSFDTYMKLVEQTVAARYPEKGDTRKGKIKLKKLKENSGWLADLNSWENGFTRVASFQDYAGDKSKAGWVLNQDMAYVYRSLATYHNPLTLKVKEFDRTFNPHTDPGTMFSLGGPVADPGDEITLVCETDLKWTSITFYNGADKLGKVKAGDEPQIKVTLDKKNLVYCLTAVAIDKNQNQFTCDPMHFFVKDPSKSWKDPIKIAAFETKKTNAGSRNRGKSVVSTSPNPTDSILVAYGLPGQLEKQFSSEDGKVSDFWNLIDDDKDRIQLSQRKNRKPDAAFNFVLMHDCNMVVKAAYGADGLYLLFEINDDNDVAWPNTLAGTENEQFYMNFDAIDVLMDSRSVEDISDPEKKHLFVSRGIGLTSTTKQYQVACGTPKEPAEGFKRSLADPWDIHSTYFSFDDAKKYLGVEIENIKTDYFYKVQEWFIPWSEYGGGFDGEPEAGTRIGFSGGYNDRDAGEHFPPGVNSSGGTVKASNGLRWIGGSDPWGGGDPPYAWGEIELGEMLE